MPVRNHRERAELALILQTRKPCQRVRLEAQLNTAYQVYIARSQPPQTYDIDFNSRNDIRTTSPDGACVQEVSFRGRTSRRVAGSGVKKN